MFTVDEYLTLERSSQERPKYLDGQIFAMAGESGAHADITVNLVAILAAQLRGTPCRVSSKDTKIRSGPAPRASETTSGLYSYPDVVVVCREVEYHDIYTDVILNPKVILEAPSPSTESFDRGEKLSRYDIWNPTLSDYLLVAQNQSRKSNIIVGRRTAVGLITRTSI